MKSISIYYRKLAIQIILFILLLLPLYNLNKLDYTGSADGHSVVELLAALIAILTGVVHIFHFYYMGNRYLLLVGTGFFISGVLDLAHAIFSHPLIDFAARNANSEYEIIIPVIYITGRIILAIFLLLAIFSRQLFKESQNPMIDIRLSIGMSIIFVPVIFFFLVFSNFNYTSVLQETLSSKVVSSFLTFFLILIIFLFMKYHFKEQYGDSEPLINWMVIALIFTLAGTIFNILNENLYDGYSIIAHFYKLMGYFTPLIGFIVYQISHLKSRIDTILFLQNEHELFENGPVVIIKYMNQEGYPVEYVSSNIKDLTGHSQSSLIRGDLNYSDLIDRQDFLRFYNEIEAIKHTNSEYVGHEPYRLQSKDDQAIWVSDYTRIIRNDENNIVYFTGYLLNITALKFIEEALRDSKQKLSQLFKQTPLAIIEWNLEMKVINWNVAAEKIFGFKKHEMIGKNPLSSIFSNIQFNDGMNLFRQIMHESQSSGVVTENITKDNETIFCQWFNTQITDGDNNIIGYSSMVQNITEKIKAEKNLKIAKQQAEAANHAKSIFLANISHEIRTPMNSILGYADILASKLKIDKHKEYIKIIVNSGKMLLALINDLLDLARIESGKMILEYHPFKLQVIIREIQDLFQNWINQKGIQMIVDIQIPDNVHLYLDETRIKQMIVNLVSNAIKFTSAGHIKITALTELDEDNKHLNLFISVEDTGRGIEQSNLQLIFEAFAQEGWQSHKEFGGTGLGLSITKRLLDIMNGTISVSSEPKKGSTFTIQIPDIKFEIKNESILPGTEPVFSIQELQQLKVMTILIGDDNGDDRALLKELFQPLANIIIEAANGSEVVNLAFKDKPDLVFLDIKMPQVDGNEAIKQLKANPETREIDIVIVSAIHPDEINKTTSSMAVATLSKPVDKNEIINTIKKILLKNSTSGTNFSTNNENIYPDNIHEIVEMIEKENIKHLIKNLQSLIDFDQINYLIEKISNIGNQCNYFIFAEISEKLKIENSKYNVREINTLLNKLILLIENIESKKDE